MQLLCELLGIKQKLDETLLEDLGSLKKAGLGRMANAFKQSYYFHTNTKSGEYGPHTSDLGKTIHARVTGVGKNSEVIPVDESVTGWTFVRKMFRLNSGTKTGKGDPVAVSFYVGGKAIALLILNEDSFSSSRNVVGLSWDFTDVGSDDDIEHIIDGVDLRDHTAGSVSEKSTDPRKSEQIHKMKPRTGSDPKKVETRHYQGVGMMVKDAAGFVDRMAGVFRGELKMRLILSDTVRKPAEEEEVPVK